MKGKKCGILTKEVGEMWNINKGSERNVEY